MINLEKDILEKIDVYEKEQDFNSLFEIFKLCYTKSNTLLAYTFGLALLDKSNTNPEIYYDMACLCILLNKTKEAYLYVEKVLSFPTAPAPSSITSNSLLILSQVIPKIQSKPEYTLASDEPNWYPCNPSCYRTETELICLNRSVNYINHGMYFTIHDSQNIIRNRNYITRFNSELNLISKKEIHDIKNRIKFPKEYVGFEDCRIFHKKDDTILFTCTLWDTHPEHVSGISLCTTNLTTGQVLSVVPCQILNTNRQRHEKNWLPFMKDDKIHAIYSYSPLCIVQIDEQTGVSVPVYEKDVPNVDYSRLRGGAGPCLFDSGYLCCVHEKIRKATTFVYFTRFFWMSKDYSETRLSKAFKCSDYVGVEFVSGIAVSKNDSIILTYGLKDGEAYIVNIEKEEVLSFF